MPPLIREMLENPEAFEDSSDSGDSAAAAPPAIQTIKQEKDEERSVHESALEEEEDEDEDYGDEERERGVDSDGEPWGEAAGGSKKGMPGRAQWERHNDPLTCIPHQPPTRPWFPYTPFPLTPTPGSPSPLLSNLSHYVSHTHTHTFTCGVCDKTEKSTKFHRISQCWDKGLETLLCQEWGRQFLTVSQSGVNTQRNPFKPGAAASVLDIHILYSSATWRVKETCLEKLHFWFDKYFFLSHDSSRTCMHCYFSYILVCYYTIVCLFCYFVYVLWLHSSLMKNLILVELQNSGWYQPPGCSNWQSSTNLLTYRCACYSTVHQNDLYLKSTPSKSQVFRQSLWATYTHKHNKGRYTHAHYTVYINTCVQGQFTNVLTQGDSVRTKPQQWVCSRKIIY